MNIVSACCHASIVEGSYTEYPLGGSTWGINYIVECCEECGKEVEEGVETCEICGEVDCHGECEEETHEIQSAGKKVS